MKLPIKFDVNGQPFSDSINESAHFEAYGKPTFMPEFRGDGYKLLVQNSLEDKIIFEPVEWNKQTCYSLPPQGSEIRRVKLTRSDGTRHRYHIEKRQFYFLMEFGFLRAGLKQACGNPRCYNPYHQSLALTTEHHVSTPKQFTITVPYLEPYTLSAYFRAAREMGFRGQQMAEISPTIFFQKTLEHIAQHEQDYESPLKNHLNSGLLNTEKTFQIMDTEPVEVEPPISDALEVARQAARDAGNMDAYVLINDVMRRLT